MIPGSVHLLRFFAKAGNLSNLWGKRSVGRRSSTFLCTLHSPFFGSRPQAEVLCALYFPTSFEFSLLDDELTHLQGSGFKVQDSI